MGFCEPALSNTELEYGPLDQSLRWNSGYEDSQARVCLFSVPTLVRAIVDFVDYGWTAFRRFDARLLMANGFKLSWVTPNGHTAIKCFSPHQK